MPPVPPRRSIGHPRTKEAPNDQQGLFEIGGYVAALVLVAFGVAAIAMGIDGRNEVRTDINRQSIVGSPGMTRSAILTEAKKAKLPAATMADLPTCDVAGKAIDSGTRAKCFASYMRIHTIEATGGKTYAQMGRFVTKDGKDTNAAAADAKDPKTGQPVENGSRNIWVNSTALTNALNTSFFAERWRCSGSSSGSPSSSSASAWPSSPSWPSGGSRRVRPPGRVPPRRRSGPRRRRHRRPRTIRVSGNGPVIAGPFPCGSPDAGHRADRTLVADKAPADHFAPSDRAIPL
jgi:hypothetical protein